MESPNPAPDNGPNPGAGAGQRRRLLEDPRSIRALAHPIRLELQSIIGRAGRITAADAARELGISHALASHHLRQLAKYGFVHQVDGADNRERPWQLVHTSHDFDDVEDQPGGSEAVAVFEQVAAERALEDLGRWHERRASWPPGWRRHSGIATSTVYLTEDEFTELMEAFGGLLARYIEQRPIDDLASRPPGSRAVRMALIVTPQDPTTAEG
ncbi:helix-turn-helix domain-containing protein [Streptomyces hokutonensis]|uniref:helix-turn-helix domain-containing protein n=1 Tax=Streptomyces hokutonensis TaxID=1306990 RepID=UPI0036B04FB4